MDGANKTDNQKTDPKEEKKYYNPEGKEISKNEFKKLEKEKKKAEEKAQKDAEKLKKASEQQQQEQKKPKHGEEEKDIDPTQYLENRKKWIADLKKKGKNPYPHKFDAKLSIGEFVNKYSSVSTEKGVFLNDIVTSLAGRIYNIRSQGPGLIFYDLIAEDVKLQVYCNAK